MYTVLYRPSAGGRKLTTASKEPHLLSAPRASVFGLSGVVHRNKLSPAE